MRGAYIHIPFCKNICSYCDFCKFTYKEEWASAYLDILEKEIDKYYEDDTLKSIYIGGGTPSSLSSKNLIRLFGIVNKLKRTDETEITFECNVNDINEELLKILKNNGVNRLSVGIQSFNKKNLEFMDRKYDKKTIVDNIKLCSSMGFENINVDLMYALPEESLLTVMGDLNSILKLPITHVSTYSLIIEEHTKIYNQGIKNIDEVKDYKMYKYICDKLKKKGFEHYEVSNFAKKGFESKHNLTYWDNEEYYGFGLGAHGFINSIRYENTRNFNKYLKKEYRLNELLVNIQEDMENEVMLGFRKLKGISITRFYKKFDRDILDVFKIRDAISKGYIKIDGDYLYIAEDKIYVMNEILNMIM